MVESGWGEVDGGRWMGGEGIFMLQEFLISRGCR